MCLSVLSELLAGVFCDFSAIAFALSSDFGSDMSVQE